MSAHMESWAKLDETGAYRYVLGRAWGNAEKRVCWVMLNPSTADASLNDPTIRRCIGFSKSWGYGAMVVVNLFALRATDPRELAKHPAPIGPLNDSHVFTEAALASVVIAAWGAGGKLQGRDAAALKLLPQPLYHLGLSPSGHPYHPLYRRGDLLPEIWSAAYLGTAT